ncbi:C40 family peptidase [Streptomyces sp. NPDC002992]|uniref:C40 family peptidase n=1 Tax=Streptomyces sp. NPDC002992 TaxID=3154273 RepID=UPI0033AD4668
MKGIAAAIGVLCLSPLLLAGTAVVAAAGDSSATTTASCDAGPVDTAAVQQQVAAVLGGSGVAKDLRIEGLELPDEQIPHARTIVATGITLGVPERGQVVALATAIQESRLRNLAYGDRDSLGLFQQRPSQGWGSPAQIRDPVYASTKFYKGLLKVAGWQQMTITQAAQAVQLSGFPDAYAQWEPLARALQKAIIPTLKTPGRPAGDGPDQLADSCSPLEDGSTIGPIPEGAIPKGYVIPTDADPRAKTALTWAMHQLGTLYQWGGSCRAPHGRDPMGRCDCSSLTQQAYKHAGVTLTRVSQTQAHVGRAVPLSQLRPGDLVFSRGNVASPEHVGLYAGHGLVIEAPRTGKPVRFAPLADYAAHSARRVL